MWLLKRILTSADEFQRQPKATQEALQLETVKTIREVSTFPQYRAG